jgi:hypothetical protein
VQTTPMAKAKPRAGWQEGCIVRTGTDSFGAIKAKASSAVCITHRHSAQGPVARHWPRELKYVSFPACTTLDVCLPTSKQTARRHPMGCSENAPVRSIRRLSFLILKSSAPSSSPKAEEAVDASQPRRPQRTTQTFHGYHFPDPRKQWVSAIFIAPFSSPARNPTRPVAHSCTGVSVHRRFLSWSRRCNNPASATTILCSLV